MRVLTRRYRTPAGRRLQVLADGGTLRDRWTGPRVAASSMLERGKVLSVCGIGCLGWCSDRGRNAGAEPEG
jgi:hypothetical protein